MRPRSRASNVVALAVVVMAVACCSSVPPATPVVPVSSSAFSSPPPSFGSDQSQTPGVPTRSPLPPATPMTTTTASAAPLRAIPLGDAWPGATIRSISNDAGNGRRLIFKGAATSDGEWLVCVTQPNEFQPDIQPTWGPSDAILVRVSDGSYHAMAKLASPTSQILFAASDGPWVVWTEADDPPSFYNWRIVAYNRDTGVTRELAHAQHIDNAVLEGPWPVPSVSRDIAVWGQAIGPLVGKDPLKNATVREFDLRSDEVRTLADHAGLPTIAWPWVLWDVARGSSGYVQIWNRETGQGRQLESLPPTIAVYGRSAAYNTRDLHGVWLIDDLASPVGVPIVGGPDDTFEWITLNARVVGYFQQSDVISFFKLPTQVYDRTLNALVDLPMVAGHSQTWAAGPLVVWETATQDESSDRSSIQIVDTRQIGN